MEWLQKQHIFIIWLEKKEVSKIDIFLTKKQNDSIKGLSRNKTLEAILKMHNKNISLDLFNEIAKSKNEYYKNLLNTKLDESYILPNIKQLILDAKKLNIKLAIASSSYNAPLILQKIGLFKYFDYIVNPNEIINGKPAPDIFLKALESINLKKDEVVCFEDAPAGLEAIRKANMFAIVISHGSKENFDNADLVVKSTKELNLDNIIKLKEINNKK